MDLKNDTTPGFYNIKYHSSGTRKKRENLVTQTIFQCQINCFKHMWYQLLIIQNGKNHVVLHGQKNWIF